MHLINSAGVLRKGMLLTMENGGIFEQCFLGCPPYQSLTVTTRIFTFIRLGDSNLNKIPSSQ